MLLYFAKILHGTECSPQHFTFVFSLGVIDSSEQTARCPQCTDVTELGLLDHPEKIQSIEVPRAFFLL